MENMFIIRINVIIVFTMLANCKGKVFLTSDKEYAPLYGQTTLTCNVDRDGVRDVKFKRFSGQLIQIGSCDVFECQTINSSKYNLSKNTHPSGYDLFYFTINDFRETDRDDYHCEIVDTGEFGSKYITYAVDIESVTLTSNTDPISVIENVQQQFTCVTSVSRPAAVVKWYLDDEEVTFGIDSVTSQDATKSTLTYTPERLHNGRRISCRGSNGGQKLISTMRPKLKILYGPSIPTCTYDGSALPSFINVKEGWEVRLNCSSDGNPTPILSWSHPGGGPSSSLVLRNVRRTHDGIFNINAKSHLVPSFQQSANLTNSVSTSFKVLYPPDPPSCHVGSAIITSSSIFAIRGMTISLNCSCDSNPASNYTWITSWVSTATSGQYLDLPIQDKTTITFIMSNTMQLTNGSAEQGKRESLFEVNILFAPETPRFHFGDSNGPSIPGNTLSVIRGSATTVTCESSANPPPSYTWNGNNETWTFTPTDDVIRTCTVRNSMASTGYGTVSGHNASTLNVNVLYPPGTPDLNFRSCLGESISVISSIKVIQGQPVHVTCSATSNPPPTYSWSRYQAEQTNVMFIPKAQTSHQGTYTCIAENSLNITFGGPVGGSSSKLFRIEVLIPPVILPLKNVVVLDGGNVSFACEVTAGVPNKTDFIWERMYDKAIVSMEQTVGIINIDRIQSGFYRCTASNLMESTGCDATIGNSSNTVFVDVQYSATVTEFVIAEFIGRNVVIVDEKVRITLNCEVESNPASTIEILKERLLLKRVFNAKNVDLVIESTACQDSGTYICSGSNHHNSVSVTRTLTVLVRCSPRASSALPPVFNVISAPGVPASLSYIFVAYPLPALSELVWEKQDASRTGWTIIKNTNNIKVFVSVDTLHTNISFTSVQQTDFGYYRLHVSNELGNTTEHFRLQAKDSGPSAGPIIGGAVGGSIGAVIAIIVVVVVLRRNYTLNCNIIRRTDAPAGQSDSCEDNPRRNTAQTYEDISMTTITSVYDALKNGEHRHDISNVYMPLEDSSSKSNVNYENF